MAGTNSSSHTLFTDESGNAGPNYLDADQPFHVDGGVLVPNSQVQRVRDIVAETIAGLNANQTELKGQRLMRSAAGQRTVAKVLDDVLAVPGVEVIFCAAERRFSLAGKAVETLLDPMHNPDAPVTFWVDHKEAIWDRFCDLDDAALLPFAACYRRPSEESMTAAIDALAEGLQALDEIELARAVAGASLHVAVIVEEEDFDGVNGFGHGHFTALNLPIYMHAAKQADRLVEQQGGRLALIHDEISRFDVVFGNMAHFLASGEDEPIEMPRLDGTSVRQNLTTFASYASAVSSEEHALQVADLVAYAVARILRSSLQRPPARPSRSVKSIASQTIARLFDRPPLRGTIMASRGTKQRLMETLPPIVAG